MIRTYKKTDKTQLSTNFKVSEFKCKCKGYCSETLLDDNLIIYLQKIRDHFGKSIHVNSGYRCKTHNKNVGGSTGSHHMKGQAADIRISGVAPIEIAKYAESIGILRIGLYDNFVHIGSARTKKFWYSHKNLKRTTFGGAYTREQFIKEIESILGVKIDGKADDEVLARTVTISSTKNNKHPLVEPIQKLLFALGYTQVGVATGKADGNFTKAVKAFQEDIGNKNIDGEITARQSTWQKLLGYEKKVEVYSQKQFVKDVQKILKLSVTGVANSKTLSKTITISSTINKKHPLVKPIQKRLYALGYKEVGEADGSAGSKFTKAVKEFQKDNGRNVDGEITARQYTWKKLLGLK